MNPVPVQMQSTPIALDEIEADLLSASSRSAASAAAVAAGSPASLAIFAWPHRSTRHENSALPTAHVH